MKELKGQAYTKEFWQQVDTQRQNWGIDPDWAKKTPKWFKEMIHNLPYQKSVDWKALSTDPDFIGKRGNK